MELLAKLFGGANKVKLLRLFLLNPEVVLTSREAAARSRVNQAAAARELNQLKAMEFLLPRAKGQARGWQLNPEFPLIAHLRGMLKNDLFARKKDLVRRFNRCGKILFLAIAGVFLDNPESRADLLIVGDKLKKRLIEQTVRGLEAEIGKELAYAVMTSEDFVYRLNACDKFVRDVLDYPHERLVDKIVYPQPV